MPLLGEGFLHLLVRGGVVWLQTFQFYLIPHRYGPDVVVVKKEVSGELS